MSENTDIPWTRGPQNIRPWSDPMEDLLSWRLYSHHKDPEFSFGRAVQQCPVNVSSFFFLFETIFRQPISTLRVCRRTA